MRHIFAVVLASVLLFGCAQESPEPSGMEEKVQKLEEKIEGIEDTVESVEQRVDVIEEEVGEIEEQMENLTVENETTEAAPPPAKGKKRFLVTVKNIHDSQTLSPGVFIVHKPIVGITFLGKLVPEEFEPLAEYGNHTPFAEYIATNNGVVSVYTIDEPVGPGEETSFTIDVSTYRPRETYLSGVQMAMGSNDGFAAASNIALFNVGNGPMASTTNALNYDAGTEQNSALLSGFEGGQPDASRGQENVDNGVATSPQQPVLIHTQLTKTIMQVVVTPQ